MNSLQQFSIGLLLILFIAGCTSSKITYSWKAANVKANHYNNILVLGLIRESDHSIRLNMEDHFVDDLNSNGCKAVSSLKQYGPKGFENMDEAEALNKLKNSNIDAVITIVLLDKQKESKYVPGSFGPFQNGYYYNRFWEYRSILFQRIYDPGYYVTDTEYFWESNFYDMKDSKLLYSAQTKSFDPANAEIMGHEYGKLIVKDLVKKHILKPKSQN